MVVDDSETARTLTKHMLDHEGHRVVEAKDGRDALGQLLGGVKVSMILLDLNMPRMTGIQFLEKAQAIVKRIPVFIVTVSGDRVQVERVTGTRGAGLFHETHSSTPACWRRFGLRGLPCG